jgi:hypothetical protein
MNPQIRPHRVRIFTLQQFYRNTAGATIIEYAITLPFFLWVMCALMEFALVMHVSFLLQDVTNRVARFAIIGTSDPGKTRQSSIENKLAQGMSAWKNFGTLEMSMISSHDFKTLRSPDSTQYSSGAGGSGEYVKYKVTFYWKTKTPFVSNLFAPVDGKGYPLTTTILIKNEEFL